MQLSLCPSVARLLLGSLRSGMSLRRNRRAPETRSGTGNLDGSRSLVSFGSNRGRLGRSERKSDLLVGLDVPARLDGAAEGAVGLLLLVLHLHLAVVHADLLHREVVTLGGGPDRVAGDKDVAEGPLHEFLLILTGLPADQGGLLDVFAAGTGEHQLGRGLVDLLGDVEVLHGHLAGSRPAAVRRGPGLVLRPAEGFELDLVLVLAVGRLALDPLDLEKRIK